MKKTLIALAAIAAAGAASAQVTVYGKFDVGYSMTSGNTENPAAAAKNINVVGVSGWETSRFGVKASEKASGLTLSVNLEGKVYDGTAPFKGFDRTATVGISGSFGTVTLGNQWTPVDNAIWTTDALEYNGFTPLAGGIWNYDMGNTGMGNAKGSIQYATPDMNGFQGFILSAPNVNDSSVATNYTGLGINYGKGPLVIQWANQSYTLGSSATTSTNVFAFNYNVGVANLYAGFVNTDSGAAATGKDSGYTFGVKVPLGNDSVSVGYAKNTTSISGKADASYGSWAAQYIKSVSKTTVAYFGIRSVETLNYKQTAVDNVIKTGAGLRLDF